MDAHENKKKKTRNDDSGTRLASERGRGGIGTPDYTFQFPLTRDIHIVVVYIKTY